MRKILIYLCLASVLSLSASENGKIFNKGIIMTFKELGINQDLKNHEIENSKIIYNLNKEFEKTFKFKTKPFKYYQFLENFNISNKKLKLISDISLETGLYIISKKLYHVDENLTISQSEILKTNFEFKSKKIFMLRYLFILKDYSMHELETLLYFYKDDEYQEKLYLILNSIKKEDCSNINAKTNY